MIGSVRVKIPGDPTPLQRVADRRAPRMARALVAVFDRVKPSLTTITAAFQASPGTVQHVPDWSQFWTITKADDDTFESVYQEVVQAAARTVPVFGGSLNLVEANAVQIAQQRAGQLVYGINADSQEAIRTVLSASLNGDYTPQETARLIRSVVGLDPRRAQAVVNYRDGLSMVQAGDMTPEAIMDQFTLSRRVGQTLSQDRIDTLVSQYADRQLASRAMTISRTETMRAAQDGQNALWDQAAQQGLFDPATAQLVWVITDEACDDCQENEAASPIPYGSDWPSGDPPVHPNCRCDISLDPGSPADSM